MSNFLVTGGAGFIGSHLCDALLARGDSVHVVDDLSTGSIANVEHLLEHPDFHFARSDVTDRLVLDRLASQADCIVHLAAAVGVKLIVERPVHTIETNIKGTEAVLEAALRYGSKVLIASTSEVYGKGVSIPFREADDVTLGPTSKNRWAYAATKMVDEFLGLAYHRQHNLPVVLFRLFNTVGPRQKGRYGMVIPRFVNQALNDEKLTVYGSGEQRRCFCHVKDAVGAIMGLAEEQDAVGRVFNIGSKEEVSIVELARRILQALGEHAPGAADVSMRSESDRIEFIPYEEAYAPGFEDMDRRVPSTQRIQDLIGWKPEFSLDEIVGEVIESQAGLASSGNVHDDGPE